MKKFFVILMMLVSLGGLAQLPYSWTAGVNPGWTSSNPTNNTLSFQSGCWNTVSTSNCTGTGSWFTYNNSQRTSYTSPIYDFSYCSTNVNVAFQLDINLENTYDWLYFQYSINGGTTWINPVALSAVNNNSGVNMSAYPPLTTACTGCNRNGWTGGLGTINLAYNIAVTSTTRFRFIFESDVIVNTYGPPAFPSIYYADILSFSVTCPSSLPIELTDFHCETKSNNITIYWTTETETNNDYFELWRSSDAINWIKILTKDGAGTSTTSINYWHQDYLPPTGTYYYRLKQVDFDGNETTSEITSCNYVQDAGVVITYFNTIGQEVKIESAVPGLYIKQYSKDGNVRREVYYKTEK